MREEDSELKKHLILVAALVFASGLRYLPAQQAPRPIFSSDAAAERIRNLDSLKKELRQYHDCTCSCGCWAHDIDRQANRAIAFLRQRAAHRRPQEKLALILDIDETALSNYQEEVGADFAYNADVFDKWIETAQAPAIPGTLRLYKEAQRLGVSIFFITGRTESEREATERNLRAQGFDGWKLLVMRPNQHGAQTIGEFKAVVRAQIARDGYRLALNVGDQWSDLKGKPEAEYSVKYPDPYYYIP
jgi:acid phosphatase